MYCNNMHIALLVTDDKTVVPLCSYLTKNDLIDNYIMRLKTLLIGISEYNIISVNDFRIPMQFGNRQTVLSDGAYIFKSNDSKYDIYEVYAAAAITTHIGYIKILEYKNDCRFINYIIEKRRDVNLLDTPVSHLLNNNPIGNNITFGGKKMTVFTKNHSIKTNCLNPGIYADKLVSFSKYTTDMQILELYHNGHIKHMFYVGQIDTEGLVSDYNTVHVFLTSNDTCAINPNYKKTNNDGITFLPNGNVLFVNTHHHNPDATITLKTPQPSPTHQPLPQPSQTHKPNINECLIAELKHRIRGKYIEG